MALAGSISVAHAEQDPVTWLKRADEALGHANFIGTMSLLQNGRQRVMRIQQGFDGQRIQQRLVALSGKGFEALRRADESTVVFPHRRLVIHGHQRSGSLIPRIEGNLDQVDKYYQLDIRGRDRVAGRDCQRVVAASRDHYRYGCELCVDIQSGLPLRVRMMPPTGGHIEYFTFTSLDVLESMQQFDQDSFRLQTDTHGFKTVGMPTGADSVSRRWRVRNLPPGFEERWAVARLLPRNPKPVYHMVLADSLSRVSVFITRLPDGHRAKSRKFTRKALNGYVTVRDGHRVTVIGGVPAETIRMIGDSLH